MERSNQTRKKSCLNVTFISFLIVMFLLAGCSTQDENPAPVTDDAVAELSDADAKKIDLPDEIIYLEGSAIFRLYKVKEHEALMEGSIYATASLEHVDGKNYILRVQEYMGDVLLRDTPFITTMTPSGALECIFPVPSECRDPFDNTLFDNPVDQLEYTTGFKLRGPGINEGTLIYKGKFVGENLFVSTHFMGLQEAFGTIPIYQQVIEGPMQFYFAFDLTVMDD